MNKISSLTISLIVHFFILKAWVYIIDSGSLPERHKIDLAETVLDLSSFSETPRKSSSSSNNKTPLSKVATPSQSSTRSLIQDVGPLLSEEDLEEIGETQKSFQNRTHNFQIRTNPEGNATFQIKNEKRIISNDSPSINKRTGNKNFSKKTFPVTSNREFNIDEGISNSKVAYSREGEGPLVEAASKLENAFWIKKPEFSYPKAAEKEGIEGTVKLKVSVNTSGTITKAIVAEKAHPILDEAALKAIYKGKIGAINNKSKNRINAEVIVIVPYKFGR